MGTDQYFYGSKSEFEFIRSELIHEEMTSAIGKYQLVKNRAIVANQDIVAAAIPGIGKFTETLAQSNIDAVSVRRDKMADFNNDIFENILELIDDDFYNTVVNEYGIMLEYGRHGIEDDIPNLQNQVQNILDGKTATDNKATLTQATIREIEEAFGGDIASTLVTLSSQLTSDQGVYHWFVDGYMFTVSRDGNTLKIINVKPGRVTVTKDAKAFLENLTGKEWTRYDARMVRKNGVDISDLDCSGTDIARANMTPGQVWKDSFKRGLNPLNNYKDFGDALKTGNKLGAVSSGIAIIGDVIMVYSDVTTNLRDDYGNWNLTASNVQKTATDIVVDVVTGAALGASSEAIVAGATAIGTAVCPGVGTAIGFVVGVAASAAIIYASNGVDVNGDNKGLIDDIKDGIDGFVDFLTFGATA
jgi:hypothetical protein